MDDYKEYELACNKIKQDNDLLLNQFKSWLKEKKLSDKVINNHYNNVDFYINTYLLYEDAIRARDGVDSIDDYLGYWFIRKNISASKSSIKGSASSLKKFYTFLNKSKIISDDELSDLKLSIREDMHEWLSTLDRYDDPSLSPEEVWRF